MTVDGSRPPPGAGRARPRRRARRTDAAGTEFTVEVGYAPPADPRGADPVDPGWVADGDEVYTAFEPHGAATLFPVNDHPSDKATYGFRVTVPGGLEVVANGLHPRPSPATV